jgi:hypothetical protein
MSAKLLLTGPHVDRALTLLALIAASTNPVERDRYEHNLKALRSAHPEVHEIHDDDPRIPARVAKLEKLGQDQIVEAFCAGCGVRTGRRLASRTEPIYCHACNVKRIFAEARCRGLE